jgi:hypothetical protein
MTGLDGLDRALGRRTVLAAVISLVGLVGAAHAYGEPDLVDLTVVNRETGISLPVWRRDGRLFVAGEQAERYSLRIANHTDGRVLVVLSVDGVNIISGETAGYNGRGYILSPYQTYEISGWRKSETQVAAFSFTSLPNSYAAETGRPGNVGVIGMAVFRERPRPTITPLDVTPAPPPPPPPPRRRLAAPPADVAPPPLPIPPVATPAQAAPPAPVAAAKPGAGEQSVVVTGSRIQRRDYTPSPPAASPKAFQEAQRQADEKLGTAHGALEWSVSHTVEFHRATPYPQEVRQIEYDSYVNLIRIGVIPSPPRSDYPPHAFPRQPGFVPDPPRP